MRAMWENLGRTFAEAFFLPEIAGSPRVTFENEAAFDEWRAWPGGKVACAAHLANWELAIAPATLSGLQPWSIYKRLRNPLVDEDVHALRRGLYTGGLVPKEAGVPRQFLRVIRDGGTVGLLTDLRDGAGALVPFFGRPAHTTTFPALLALSAGSPILVSCMRRVSGVRFVQSYALVRMPDSGDRKADLLTVTAEVQAVFEGLHPALAGAVDVGAQALGLSRDTNGRMPRMRIATWNVNSVRQRLPHLVDYLGKARPDALCLQELKCADEAFPRAEVEAAGYRCAVHGQKGFNGVAILTLAEPVEVRMGLPGDEADVQSRYIEAVMPGRGAAPCGSPASTCPTATRPTPTSTPTSSASWTG